MRARPLLLAAAPSLTFLTASLGWALLDRFKRAHIWNP